MIRNIASRKSFRKGKPDLITDIYLFTFFDYLRDVSNIVDLNFLFFYIIKSSLGKRPLSIYVLIVHKEVFINRSTHLHKSTHIHLQIPTETQAHNVFLTHSLTLTRTRTRTHTHTHTHTYTHTHTNTQTHAH